MEQNDEEQSIDIEKNRYPYCIVWTPLPLITALFPFIGHTGICTSDGIIYDFSGSFSITVDDMAFGDPTKYVKIDYADKQKWDDSIERANISYKEQEHNLCFNNCHSHVASALNYANYKTGGWNMIYVTWILILHGKYTGFSGFLKTYIGFFIILSVLILAVYFGSR